MKKLLLILSLLLLAGGTTEVYSQAWLKKLGKKAEKAAKNAVERNVEKKVDKAVDNAFDGAEDAVKNGNKNNGNDNVNNESNEQENADTSQSGEQQKGQSLEMTYAKSDFVPGDEIIFDDPMDEQMGEFPSKWDLLDGVADVASFNSVKGINVEEDVLIAPLMKDMKHYLTDKFTIEMDFWVCDDDYFSNRERYIIRLYKDHEGRTLREGIRVMEFTVGGSGWTNWNYKSTSGDDRNGEGTNQKIAKASWHHLAISFNQRAFKAYIDGIRVANIPNMEAPEYMTLELWKNRDDNGKPANAAVTNIRIAKGAVPLYDRMMSEGKFITYGIMFDVGKSTIKPESMGEINRIVKLMTENPDLKFSVEGHTDSTGNEASNQTLSEQRSQAIVAKLVEQGIAQERLTAVGKGQTSPIADNGTDEGRAKNRRVEFVKI